MDEREMNGKREKEMEYKGNEWKRGNEGDKNRGIGREGKGREVRLGWKMMGREGGMGL